MNFGGVDIDFIGHAGFLVRYRGQTIVIDPYHISESLPKADLILITHGHSDHCSLKDIQKIVRDGTVILCPVDCQSTILKIKNVNLHIISDTDIIDFGRMKVEGFPAYTSHPRHAKQEGWLGYVLKFGKTVIYFAGDTDYIPEMQLLSGYGKKGNTFVAVLPIAGDVVMNPSVAAKAALVLNPTIVIPMSYGSGVYGTEKDAQLFVEICKQLGVNATMLPKI